jgi:beta-glucosidase
MKKWIVVIIMALSPIITWSNTNVDSLLKVMTLDEKIGQMTQMCFSTITLDGSKSLDLNVDNFRQLIQKQHIGSFLSGSDSYQKWFDFVTAIQKVAVEETRLGIPLIIGIDHVHGANYISEGTIFPHNLMLACSFNKTLLAKVAKVTAIETAPVGLSWNFAPVLDVGRTPYWPRFYETFGEDTHLCSELGSAFISAYQNVPEIAPYKLSACAKHFIGYSDPKYGYDRTPSEIPMQTLHEIFVPPFRKAFEAGVKTLMVNSGELNGEPVHGSKFLLDTLLRKQLGFDGVIVSDIKDIERIVKMHHTAINEKEATLQAIKAGIDMYMACNSYTFIQHVKELLAEGKLSIVQIDASVRRILKLKFELGLFDHPYPSKKIFEKVNMQQNRKVALEAAESSIVLLKNENILPLVKSKKILLAGIGANSKRMLNGPWSYDWLGAVEAQQPQSMLTLFEACKNTFGEKNVYLSKTEQVLTTADVKVFTRDTRIADVIVLAIGEQPYSEFMGNINDLTLDANQLALVDAAIATKKPVLLILMEGRPRIITKQAAGAKAILFVGYPGIEGAQAIANILSGKTNPSAKLAFSYPLAPSHTIPYNYKPSEYNIYWKTDKTQKWLYPFGYGLNYSTFEYSDLKLSDSIISPTSTVMASVKIKNTSSVAGTETLLWYISDKVGSISRPVKTLKHFEKVRLNGGEAKTVNFEITPCKHLAFPTKNGYSIIENGYFVLTIGNQVANIKIDSSQDSGK